MKGTTPPVLLLPHRRCTAGALEAIWEHAYMAGVGVVRCLAALVVIWVVCGIAMAGAALAQGEDDLVRLSAEVSRLHRQAKYAQALPIAQRYVELARQQ
jgi:hypothetical protein